MTFQITSRHNGIGQWTRFVISPVKFPLLATNGNFNTAFQYNMSGIEIRHNGLRYISERITNNKEDQIERSRKNLGNVQLLFESQTRLSLVPEIVVSGIRADSPAKDAGLQEGDVILAVNGKKVYS